MTGKMLPVTDTEPPVLTWLVFVETFKVGASGGVGFASSKQ
jgi:hypothetical protein